MFTDDNTTYAYLANSIVANILKVDVNGYIARYTYAFPTTPANVTDERYSSLVASASTSTAKKVITPSSQKFYIDRLPYYSNAGSYEADTLAGAMYQYYTGMDLRYNYNTNANFVSTAQKVYLYLHDFDISDMSFKSDATLGNICSADKLSTRFASANGYVYLFFMGTNTTTWYSLTPNIIQDEKIWRYNPANNELIPLSKILLEQKANTSSLATVAISGNYNDLTNKPTIPTIPTNVSAFANDVGYLTEHQPLTDYVKKTTTINGKALSSNVSLTPADVGALASNGKALTAGVADSANSVEWDNVQNKPSEYTPTEHTHVVNDITDFPALATVATSGSYNDLSDIPQEFNPPIATSTTLGGITVGDNLVVDENGKLSAISGSSGLTIGDVYPVGSIYMSMVDTNPRLLFGIGEWERIGQGRTLIDCGEDYEAGSEGGEATHTITVDEMPSHNHTASSGDAGAHTPSGTVNGTTAGGTVNSYTLNGACYTTSTDKNAQILADTALSWSGIVSSYGNRTANTMSNTSSSYSFSSGFKVSASHGHTFTGTSHSHTFTGTAVSAHKHTITVDNSGGGVAMNNMQPYLAIYIWKRVA